MCECGYCIRRRVLSSVLATGNPVELTHWILAAEDRLLDTESDLDYYKAVEKGSWPSSGEQGAKIMARAITYATTRKQLMGISNMASLVIADANDRIKEMTPVEEPRLRDILGDL